MRLRKKEGVDPVVAPLAGAWIEMYFTSIWFIIVFVAPLAGAWIEIPLVQNQPDFVQVAPLAGAWIEIYSHVYSSSYNLCRSPRGSVD